MPTPTEEQQHLFNTVIAHAGFGANLAPHIGLYEVDDPPEEDERGWRKADGWKMSCEETVTQGIHTPTFWGLPDLGGVTLTMEIQCLKAAKVGTKYKVDVEIVKCSNRLANLRCEIKDFHTGKIFATGTHLKIWSGNNAKTGPIDTMAALAKL
ncbi:hypothetical protein I316_02258 [Kwoniella heveanensis BCC8398]|uniref:Thioesterase domain-containing protein n=1 Tax=Kwoniella heveanensis BCC8398 TaxID=1296120 RepID=A0A1B9GXM5_9TREE|nr:hypothetical protein I316_02258 [Kwoniella heveanensis BCC8398]